MSTQVTTLLSKGALEAGLFLSSCIIFRVWMSKRTKQDNNKGFVLIDHEKYLERTDDPEDTTRKLNVYPEEKIVVRFLH